MNRSNFPPNRAPRTADQGIGTFVRRMAVGGEATMDPYFESLGYLPGEKELRTSGGNVLSALSAFDPVQGIMRGMTSAGVAADSRYSSEQRKEALIEAGLETIIPVSMIGAGKLAKEPAKKVLMDLLSPTGAPDEVSARPAAKAAPVDNTPDNPSRRKFLEGAGAAVFAAGVTPDILAEIIPKITRAAARVAPDLLKNPLVMAAAKIKALKKSTDELYASRGVISESTDSVADLARDRQLTANAYEKIDTVENVFKSLADPKTGKQTIKEAPDDVLEEILSVQYEGSTSAFERIQAQMEGVDGFDPATEIAQEIKRRGLDTAKNKEGILQFPYARQFMEDVLEEGGMPNLNTSFKNPITNMSKNAAKLLEDQIFDVTKNIRGFGPTSNIAATPNLKVDNPGGDWLADKLEYAKEDRAKARVENSYQANLGNSAGVTGYFPEALQLDPNILAKVKGAMGEEAHRASGDKIKRLQKSIQEKGYDPSPILVHVREDGVPFIVEGNTRVAEAIESGRSSIPVEIKYLRGAETVDGPFNPEKLLIPDSVEMKAEGGPVGIGTLSNTAKNMFQEAVEPFDPEKHSPIQTAGQSTATEYTSTTESPDGDVWNIPQIWFSVETGEPVLKTGDDAWAAAYEYEKKTGKMFPRFNSIPEAESAAQSRSDQGGASEQPLARMDGGPVYGIGSLNQTARNMFR
jgi:hypothetical protein